MDKKPPPDRLDEARKGAVNWMKYSGMAIQMAVVILVFVLAGQWLDGYFGTDPILTVVCSLLGVGGGLYSALRDFL